METKPEAKEVIIIDESDIKKMIYITSMRVANIESKLDDLIKLAKEQDGNIQ